VLAPTPLATLATTCAYTDRVMTMSVDIEVDVTTALFAVPRDTRNTWISLSATGDIDLLLTTADGVTLLEYAAGGSTNWYPNDNNFTYGATRVVSCVRRRRHLIRAASPRRRPRSSRASPRSSQFRGPRASHGNLRQRRLNRLREATGASPSRW
jgi:hypothetical protein